VFPEYKTIPFKIGLEDRINRRIKKADLAMIRFDYLEWFVIEVELHNHSLNHVKEQVESFHNCDYGKPHADYIFKQGKGAFNNDSLEKMVEELPPKLMVIADEPKEQWIPMLESFNCQLSVFQTYLNKKSHPVYRLDGDHPLIHTEFCFCRLRKDIPYTLEILESQCFMQFKTRGTSLKIDYQGRVSKWNITNTNGKVYLLCNEVSPLNPTSDRYKLSYHKKSGTFKLTNS
jgi:hypothetical protein